MLWSCSFACMCIYSREGAIPECSKGATSVNVQLTCLQKDLRAGMISRDIVNFPSELCRRRSGMYVHRSRTFGAAW